MENEGCMPVIHFQILRITEYIDMLKDAQPTTYMYDIPITVEPLLSGQSGTYYCPYLRNVHN